MKIELGKQYKTRDGREVRIYATDGTDDFPVHGAVLTAAGWKSAFWAKNGGYTRTGDCSTSDLIEVRPRIKRTVWVNVYRHDDGAEFVELHDRRDQADGSGGTARVACVKLTIDCEEGEGL